MHEVPAQYVLSPCAPTPRTLVDILYDTAARYPEATAIDDGDVQLTYSELISDIEDSVEWLAARGIGRGDRIGIRMPSGGYALYVAILATLATGAAYVPDDPDDPDERTELVFSEGATVGPASLVMRGDEVPPSTRWQGNPIVPWNAFRKKGGATKPPDSGVEETAA
jgi:non-ribosomal peptide synthetase component F